MKIASKGLGWSFESTCAVNVLNGLSFGLLLSYSMVFLQRVGSGLIQNPSPTKSESILQLGHVFSYKVLACFVLSAVYLSQIMG